MVTVELRQERGKLYAQAVIETEYGPLVIDHVYVRPGPARPRVELPQRPVGQMWVPVVRLPEPLYMALVSAITDAMRP